VGLVVLSNDGIKVGEPSTSDFGFLDPTGMNDLANLQGRVTVLARFALLWPICGLELPDLGALAQQYPGQDVLFYALHSSEPPDLLADFIARTGIGIPVVSARGTSGLFAYPQGVGCPHPRDVVVGKGLSIRSIRNRFDAAEMDELIRELLAEWASGSYLFARRPPMGLLIEGQWHDRWYDTSKTGGRFVRKEVQFRDRIEAGSIFEAARDRYHLYVSHACPWAHRTMIVRTLKKLEDVISVSVVEHLMMENGWEFSDSLPDHLHGLRYLHEIYTKARPDYSGRVTVPVLWDRQRGAIVNNESSEIIRFLNSEFDAFGDPGLDLYPAELRAAIDEVNERVYQTVNNGVYRSGFATTQEAYEEAVVEVFESLDWLEGMLSDGRNYLLGDRLTEADIRLFTTLVRFDPVYHLHFKCNLRRLVDYPRLWAFTRRVYGLPGIAATVHMDHIKRHYFESHRSINPHGVVPVGPIMDLAPGGAP
jgi:putative glutathione S-transferase